MKLKILQDTMADGKPVTAGVEIEVQDAEAQILINEAKALDPLAPVAEIEIAETPRKNARSTPDKRAKGG